MKVLEIKYCPGELHDFYSDHCGVLERNIDYQITRLPHDYILRIQNGFLLLTMIHETELRAPVYKLEQKLVATHRISLPGSYLVDFEKQEITWQRERSVD